MKFVDLKIGAEFFTEQYGDNKLIKLKHFGGSCCSPPHNAKLLEMVNGILQQKTILLNDQTEVYDRPFQTESLSLSEETIKMRLSVVERGTKFTYNGEVYQHDPNGRDGGGKFAVVNVNTGERLALVGTVEVEVFVESPQSEVVEMEFVEDQQDLYVEELEDDGLQEDTESL